MKKTGYVLYTDSYQTDIQKNPTWNSPCIGTLINGAIITIISEQDGWFEILNCDSTAWIPCSRVYLPTKFIPLVGEVANPNSSSTNVQRIPSSVSNQYSGEFDNGTKLTIISENNGWYQFLNDGATSWIRCSDIMIRKTGYVLYNEETCTDIQGESTWNSSCVGTLINGAIITITGEQEGWFEILNCDSAAWIPCSRVYIPIKKLSLTGEVITSTNVQRIPSLASNQYAGHYSPGASLTIISKNNGWYQFLDDGATAWIPCNTISLTKISNVNGVAGDRCSANLIYFLKEREGFAPSRYCDSGGVVTDGYGMTRSEIINLPSVISEETATQLLAQHLNTHYYSEVLSAIKANGISNPLQREVDAFTDFAYNLGVSALIERSTLFKKYIAGVRGDGLKYYFQEWDKTKIRGQLVESSGLLSRRTLEWDIFCGNNVTIPGYNCKPSIAIVNTNAESVGIVTTNNGYGANPY